MLFKILRFDIEQKSWFTDKEINSQNYWTMYRLSCFSYFICGVIKFVQTKVYSNEQTVLQTNSQTEAYLFIALKFLGRSQLKYDQCDFKFY